MELTGAIWRKSTRSDNGGATCVEVATNLSQVVGVRDSKDRRGPALTFAPAAWSSFVASTRAGSFADRP
ncbi:MULTISPECIES: DUF397 domain-containing protein [Micromonospora]|uniref:DUF397 domain-containing protein n=1 Tax=Micromonospora rifamycinica TaxID=291594 RepID=A0A120F9C0_9ACTN|nr:MULTISPECIES: DUF397 domain-containing protein [Micromonospora]KWV33186.1 DUF397 domain-containing protein [Micromonospora rifamycinica]WFE64493.1 DUF397 domain-containing protein [Micromonospora sp. WMMD714]SCG54445.1 protein of unknown function [Micromonospora rifamycinica]